MKVIDMHCDTIMGIYQAQKKGENVELRSNNLNISIEKMKAGDYLTQTFAMFVPLGWVDNAFEVCNEMIDVFYNELAKNEDQIKIAYSGSDIERNMAEGKMSALLSCEEGGVTNCNIRFLRNLYRLGVRMMTLTWNFENGIGVPNIIAKKGEKPDTTKPNPQGLTPFGLEMIKEMERLGIIIDVSHLSDGGFWDVYNNTSVPFIASHSNARGQCNHVRNLTDEMILALHSRGGVMGINYAADFLEVPPENPEGFMSTVDNMVKHALYIKNLTGDVDCIGLGSDFDGISQNLETKDASQLSMLENKLRENGFSEEEIEKIFYKNVLRVFKAVLG